MDIKLGITLPESIVQQIEKLRGNIPRSRLKIISVVDTAKKEISIKSKNDKNQCCLTHTGKLRQYLSKGFVFMANLLYRAKHSTKHYFNFDKLFFSYN
jgi:hypothetical protein